MPIVNELAINTSKGSISRGLDHKGHCVVKINQEKVYKFTYPGRLVKEIDQEIRKKSSNTEAANLIIHSGTNNLTTNSGNECVNKMEHLCSTARSVYPNAQIGFSSLTERYDLSVHDKLVEVNSEIEEMFAINNYTFIHNVNIDRSCLNNSKIHFNAKGLALLAVSFINFIRGRKQLSQVNQSKNFWLDETLRQLGAILGMARRRTP